MKAAFRYSIVLLLVMAVTAWVTGCGEDSSTGPDPDPENHSPNAPTIDTGSGAPSDGATDVSIMAELHWQCSDPDGDALTYDVYFGTSSPPPEVASAQSAMAYDPVMMSYSTTYYWKIVAEDPDAETASSPEWSFTTAAATVETVGIPDTPTGNSAGTTGTSLAYSTGGSVSSMGHTVEYRFDWDDGTYSSWSTGTGSSHSWSSAGTYDVRAQARCQAHTSVISDWSTVLSVTISEPAETINQPVITTYPTGAIFVGEQADFFMGPAVSSSLGHTLEFRYDFGDGNYSDWSATKDGSHTYSAAGTYEVRGQARCTTHTDVESAWSDVISVEVTSATETVSTPEIIPPMDMNFNINSTKVFGATATSSLGHDLQFRYDWGNGDISEWNSSAYMSNPAYGTPGDYDIRVQARCSDHTDVESAWCTPLTVTVTEYVSNPDGCSGPATGIVGELITFTTGGSTSSEGHALEYQLWVSSYYSDMGSPVGEWRAIDDLTYTFDQARTWYVRIKARCIDHQVESNWSAYHVIAISQP